MLADRARRLSGSLVRALLLWIAVVVIGVTCFAAETAPPIDEALDGRVRALLALDQWIDALELAREAFDRDPDDTRVHAVLAQCLFRAGRLVELDRRLPEWAAGPDASPRTLALLGRLRAAQGRRDAAARALQRAVAQAPLDRDILYWAGDLSGTRSDTVDLLTRYVDLSEGDDPDRIAAAEGALRSLKELGDRRVWVPLESPESLTVPLIHIWDLETRGSSEAPGTRGYVVVVAAGPKAKPVKLLLDTGSHGLSVLARVGRKRGFTPLAETTQVGGGGDRRQRSQRGLFSRVSLGGLVYENALVSTIEGELDPTGRFHGLLGVALFGGYRVVLDFDRKRLELTRDASPLDGVDYWWVSGQLLVEAQVGEGRGLFVLDTGASTTVVASRVVEREKASAPGQRIELRAIGGLVSGARELRGLSVQVAELDSLEATLVSFDFSDQNRVGGIEVLGLIGLDLLAGQRIEIDTVAQRLWISDPSARKH